MSDAILSGLMALLIGAVGFLSYALGRKVEKNEEFKRKADAVRNADAARSSLRDPSNVERLHDKYRR